MHQHKQMRLATTSQEPGDMPRQTFVVLELEHDHGPIADGEKHDHAIGMGIEVDGRTITLTRATTA